jgi:hypothetical protein
VFFSTWRKSIAKDHCARNSFRLDQHVSEEVELAIRGTNYRFRLGKCSREACPIAFP